jgi:sterol desaturase/sphingolipid hydroxylase (fatty acid hydroxylase superfamily)
MDAETRVALLIPATFLLLMLFEKLKGTGPTWEVIPWWRAKGFAFFIVLMTINAVLPSWVPPQLARFHLLNGAALGVLGGVIVGYPVLALFSALLHRAYHRFGTLWPVHQLHHAPQRLDIAGSVVFTPLEVVNGVILSLTVMVFVLGLDPLAAAIVGYIAAFYGMFQHLNVRTPRWLGYVIQRPESHSLHHERGVHAWNYSDFPLWDMLWGTFRNPGDFAARVGFEQAESRRVGAMLMLRDVNAPTLSPGNRGRIQTATNPA